MLIKAIAIGVVLASTPIYFAASSQDPKPKPPRTSSDHSPLEQLRREMERLEADLESALLRAEQAEGRERELDRQLDESLKLLQHSTQRRQRRNCTPSRSMLTYYQWMHRNGHDEQATAMLDRAIAESGDDLKDLNRLAHDLMTRKSDTCFDCAALAVAERMQKHEGKLSYRMLDTIALAKFLNGHVEEAATLQQKAIAKGGDNDDYRRRLKVYRAALKKVSDKAHAAPEQ